MNPVEQARALAVRQMEIAAEAAALAGNFSEDELSEELLATFAADAARRAAADLEALARRLGGGPIFVLVATPGTTHTA